MLLYCIRVPRIKLERSFPFCESCFVIVCIFCNRWLKIDSKKLSPACKHASSDLHVTPHCRTLTIVNFKSYMYKTFVRKLVQMLKYNRFMLYSFSVVKYTQQIAGNMQSFSCGFAFLCERDTCLHCYVHK